MVYYLRSLRTYDVNLRKRSSWLPPKREQATTGFELLLRLITSSCTNTKYTQPTYCTMQVGIRRYSTFEKNSRRTVLLLYQQLADTKYGPEVRIQISVVIDVKRDRLLSTLFDWFPAYPSKLTSSSSYLQFFQLRYEILIEATETRSRWTMWVPSWEKSENLRRRNNGQLT